MSFRADVRRLLRDAFLVQVRHTLSFPAVLTEGWDLALTLLRLLRLCPVGDTHAQRGN